ncbi:MAG TPA: hypothetical protein VE135_23540 [Pyrinomonadaceae bacterium]|nr:hypothetical protein [Pyrinomonadaceae bacterium]
MLKHIGFIVAIVIIALLVFFFLIPFEDQLLDSLVTTGPEITLDFWRESFRFWALVGVGIALLAALLWFVLGQWWFSLDRWTSADKRTIWITLGVVALVAAVPGVVLTPAAQEGGRLAWPFYLLNNLIVFYLSTVLFSPASFKYTPWASSYLRWW